MSTLTLKNHPSTVATLAPVKAKAAPRSRAKKTRISAAEWIEKNPPPGPDRPHLHMGEYLRKARLSEG